MSELIDILQKRIYIDKPVTGASGQYNFGRVGSNDSVKLMGVTKNPNVDDGDLFTTVYTLPNENMLNYPYGLLSGFGSELEVSRVDTYYSYTRYKETDGWYYNVKYALYLVDGKMNSSIFDGSGKTVKEDIGTGDGYHGFSQNSHNNRLMYNKIGNGEIHPKITFGAPWEEQLSDRFGCLRWYRGSHDKWIESYSHAKTYTGPIAGLRLAMPGADHRECKEDSGKGMVNPKSGASGNPIATNFHLGENYGRGIKWGDIRNWSDSIMGVVTGAHAHLTLINRLAGDEREKRPGFKGRTDERYRIYARNNIPKKELYKIWREQRGASKTFNVSWNEGLGSDVLADDRSGRGYKTSYNRKQNIWFFSGMDAKITAPTWRPTLAIRSIKDGGSNANWIKPTLADDVTPAAGWHCLDTVDPDTGARYGLHPRYGMDIIPFPSSHTVNGTAQRFWPLYGSDGNSPDTNSGFNYDLIQKAEELRPITFISSSLYNVDVQGYYEGDSDNDEKLRIQGGAPNEVKFSLKLAESSNNVQPTYIDPINDDEYNFFKYWFFVVDWDWSEPTPGGGECEQPTYEGNCISDISQLFPTSTGELAGLQQQGVDTFIPYQIGVMDESAEPGTQEYGMATHTYMNPGIYVIKALMLTTMGNYWSDGSTQPYSDYIQSVGWKLITTRINLTAEGGLIADFGDLGGDNFTYLPYPDVVDLDDEINGDAPSGNLYRASHIIIGGLSEDSVYVNSLKSIIQKDPFGAGEIRERNQAKKSIDLSPIGRRREWGKYFGQSDISQVRYFNKSTIQTADGPEPLDMRALLEIDTVYNPTTFFPHYNVSHWDGSNNSFPLESSVGDIFIDDYDYLKEDCLFEINCWSPDGKTLRDSTGKGNKGILIGDYSIKKEEVGSQTVRDSYIKIPEIGDEDGAF